MKKALKILFSFLLIIPMLVANLSTISLFQREQNEENYVNTPSPTGEGQNSIIDDIVPDYPQNDDDKNEIQPVSTIEYVKKTYEEYFTDNNISSDIADTTITGTGTKDDPYIIYSGEDMWYFSKYIGGLHRLVGRYFELGDDIILNDEVFDGEGNISGGDGVIYNWSVMYGKEYHFDGKGHTIKGLYMNYPETGGIAFLHGEFHSVQNLNFESFYIRSGGSKGSVIAVTMGPSVVGRLKNCRVGEGLVTTSYNYWLAGLVSQCVIQGIIIENCINEATVVAEGGQYHTGGIAAEIRNGVKIINCKNYGSVSGKRGVGGIVGTQNNAEITDCENYGKITSTSNSYYVGGITGECTNSCVIFNCKNYGEVNGAGITGQPGSFLLIQKCENHGEVLNGIYSLSSSVNTSVVIDNCANYSRTPTNYFGSGYHVTIKNCHITACQNLISAAINAKFINCKITIDESSANQTILSKSKVSLRDCEITTHSNVLIDTSSGGSVEFENVIWNSINKVKSDCRLVSDEALVSTFEKNGVIVQNYDKSTKSYDNSFYGVDFKRFYISWKTGKIGLTKLDGTGAFQDIINVAKLKNLGYVWEDDIKESTYTQLEYIESTGGQYIDSGFVITNQNFNLLRIEIDAVLDVDGENTQWELNGTAGGSPYCGLGISNTGLLSYGAGDRIRTTSVSIATKKTERHLYVMDYKNKALYIDGEKIANCSITDLTSKSFSKNFYLFASNSSNEAIYNKQIRKYSIKIYVNDELARNYIPVLRDVDGKVGMYDLVEKKFYVNFGTGSFIAGNKTNWNL